MARNACGCSTYLDASPRLWIRGATQLSVVQAGSGSGLGGGHLLG